MTMLLPDGGSRVDANVNTVQNVVPFAESFTGTVIALDSDEAEEGYVPSQGAVSNVNDLTRIDLHAVWDVDDGTLFYLHQNGNGALTFIRGKVMSSGYGTIFDLHSEGSDFINGNEFEGSYWRASRLLHMRGTETDGGGAVSGNRFSGVFQTNRKASEFWKIEEGTGADQKDQNLLMGYAWDPQKFQNAPLRGLGGSHNTAFFQQRSISNQDTEGPGIRVVNVGGGIFAAERLSIGPTEGRSAYNTDGQAEAVFRRLRADRYLIRTGILNELREGPGGNGFLMRDGTNNQTLLNLTPEPESLVPSNTRSAEP
jgi:hypothetical protein